MNPLNSERIEARLHEIGQQIFKLPKLHFLKKNYWYTKLIDLATRDPRVKTQLFRFVDVLPVLQSTEQKVHHLLEYLSAPSGGRVSWPLSLRAISGLVRFPGLNSIISRISDFQVQQMAGNFILGETAEVVLPRVMKRREQGLAFTLDILGEAVLSDDEAAHYQATYLELIEKLGTQTRFWKKIPLLDESDLGPIPAVNLSVKISSLDCRMDPAAFEDSLARLEKRIEPILSAALKYGIFINFDMEQFAFKDLTRELFKRLVMKPEFKNYRHFGIVVQAYLKSSHSDVEDWAKFAKARGTSFTIRLVKGAYWDFEVINADQNGWEPPVYMAKFESDQNYEHCSRTLIDAYPNIEIAVASHNVRSISYALAYAEAKGLKKNALEVQMLYGMADPFKEALAKMQIRVREYDPIGDMLPGLSYLVRRLLENSSNDSFLKQSFLNKSGIHELLQTPKKSVRTL